MDTTNWTTDQLRRRIEELEALNRELLAEKEAEVRLDYAWTGNLGHWYWNIKTNSVVFNPLKVQALGYTPEEVPESVEYQFFTEKLHPDDCEATMEAMRRHMKGEIALYEAEYRLRTKTGGWKWFYDRGKVTRRDAEGRPLYATGIVFDITEKKEREMDLTHHNALLKQTAETDALTGIRNRRAILDELEAQIAHAAIYKTPLTVVLFDIDRFKSVNDERGHIFGDKVLKESAAIIAHTLRGIDSVGRYGGEEFLVVLPNTDRADAISVAERIRKNIESFDYGNGFRATISGGVAEYCNQHRGSGSAGDENEKLELIGRADKMLYEAKAGGRNRIIG